MANWVGKRMNSQSETVTPSFRQEMTVCCPLSERVTWASWLHTPAINTHPLPQGIVTSPLGGIPRCQLRASGIRKSRALQTSLKRKQIFAYSTEGEKTCPLRWLLIRGCRTAKFSRRRGDPTNCLHNKKRAFPDVNILRLIWIKALFEGIKFCRIECL